MADVWVDERPEHGKWKVTADDGDIRYVSAEQLTTRKAQLEAHIRNLESQKAREQLKAEAELTQVEADLVQIAIEEEPPV